MPIYAGSTVELNITVTNLDISENLGVLELLLKAPTGNMVVVSPTITTPTTCNYRAILTKVGVYTIRGRWVPDGTDDIYIFGNGTVTVSPL